MIIVPISELANPAALERRCLEAGGLVFVKKGDNLRLVVMDMDYFKKFIRERDLISLINEGSKRTMGRFVNGEEAKRRIEKRLEIKEKDSIESDPTLR